MNDIPAAKIKMMKGSMRCLVFGLLGLLPIIGLPFALAALWVSGRVRAQEKMFWNAAKSHRVAGLVCAAFGAVIWSFVDILLIYHAFNNYASA
jgi:hypothetical protein